MLVVIGVPGICIPQSPGTVCANQVAKDPFFCRIKGIETKQVNAGIGICQCMVEYR